MKYIIGLDQSTQGTKALLFDENGRIIERVDKKHAQLINELGYVSHDLDEIYENTKIVIKDLIEITKVNKEDVLAIGISNQRETTGIWDKEGKPLGKAIVWQCNRAESVIRRFYDYKDMVYSKTGLPLSPFFPAAKMKWLLENVEHGSEYCLGTMDSYLIYRLTGGASFVTDSSNASRTQLFNIQTLSWDEEICGLLGIPMKALAKVCDSNSKFGMTDLDGYLDKKIPIHSAMGDSHAALYGQMCHQEGMVKATYGTGSSIMMNTGSYYVSSKNGLASSLAWSIDGKVDYVLEGNINYAGAVITWLMDDVHLLNSTSEIKNHLENANKKDSTILVPAFSGLGAPHWNNNVKAMLYGMSRTTGQSEIVKAAIDSIAFQVSDVLEAMKEDYGSSIKELRVDGGPTKNTYLMEFQSNLTDLVIAVARQEELSAIGVAYLAGISIGLYTKETVFNNLQHNKYLPNKQDDLVAKRKAEWKQAIEMLSGNI